MLYFYHRNSLTIKLIYLIKWRKIEWKYRNELRNNLWMRWGALTNNVTRSQWLMSQSLHPVYIITEPRSILMTDSSLATFLIPLSRDIIRDGFSEKKSYSFHVQRSKFFLFYPLSTCCSTNWPFSSDYWFEWWSEKKVHRIILLKVSLHFSFSCLYTCFSISVKSLSEKKR